MSFLSYEFSPIARLELESRLQAGDYAGARRAYLGVRSAYKSRGMWTSGLVLMLLSPRLYTAVFSARNARRTIS